MSSQDKIHSTFASIIISAPFEQVGKYVSNFHGLSIFHPFLTKSESEKEGKVRRLSLKGTDQQVVEEDLSFESCHGEQSIGQYYKILSSGFVGMTNYQAILKAIPITETQDNSPPQTFVSWQGTWHNCPETAQTNLESVEQVYRQGLLGLKKLIDSQALN
mmetsp:Transcript_1819/g.2611  ORF Transcript_1819/g.2611 Transcript_1819/m.2611 type:complete len:160 (-) Transcript_1819:21-500(-)|eukprot:CAMPEP_0201552580 /NCGR_PEP_ID=MMETSP0173_2-20130828/16797_1 /ASSEMBLY_ACC=CAM_ASM_000268 /TAXON_ID=218659 /ORGANISM="Vexillifera sp., Strain DIVA3 564/2" /LENGTH=159 /DNA_ID=CAMNT_0047963081 /DNA_START=69 /DNA_END=548 /DNA_ORIENTATION=-